MKFIKRLCLLTVLCCMLMSNSVLANQLNWEAIPGNHDESILLSESETVAVDSVHRYGRGEFLAEGSVQIVNEQNGDIYISVDTFAYVNVDKIFHTVFLEYWDENENDWIQVNYWDFEKTKEEAGGELYRLSTNFTLTGYETGLYYRVRGLHGIELNDEVEACATRTNGVLITDN